MLPSQQFMSGRELSASPPPAVIGASAATAAASTSTSQLNGEPSEFPFNDRSVSTVTTPKTTAFVGRSLGVTDEQRSRYINEQRSFGDKREILVTALDDTTTLVKSLAAFNQEKWTVHYPHQLGVTMPCSSTQRTSPARSASAGPRPESVRRSASEFGGEEHATQDDVNMNVSRPLQMRSYSTVETPVKSSAALAKTDAPPPHPLSILTLDLKLGHPGATTASLPALLPSLSHATLSQLLSRRLTSALGHIQSLRLRVTDKSSRILITGDLNAGKSTFVNALLRRDIMPSDQQPCTTLFCEVLDATAFNDAREEIHAIRDVDAYDATDKSTYDTYTLEEINELQDPLTYDDRGVEPYTMLKAFVIDERAPPQVSLDSDKTDEATVANPSFIRNGLVSISLIDAPGLNRDTISTTALFARQSEIDVIVFVVSAENHFTLSAKEFLWNASREKAHVFIVVNKWSGIRDKKRCMRVVGEQIKQLSPKTWENRDELVHFVDAADVVDDDELSEAAAATADDAEEMTPFDHLEQSLRSFVLLRRTTSKLAPAKNYLINLLGDLATLAATNVDAASRELEAALERLDIVKPVHEKLMAQRDEVEDGVDRVEETVVQSVRNAAWSRLERALDFVAEGRVVEPLTAEETGHRVTRPGSESPAEGGKVLPPRELPAWQGVWNLWEWATEVKKTLVKSLEAEVRAAEDEARAQTSQGVDEVVDDIGSKFLPAGADPKQAHQQKKQERVFRPEVMFAKRRRGLGKLSARGASAGLGLGTGGLGIGSTWTATDFDVSFFDLFDFERLFAAGQWLKLSSLTSSQSVQKRPSRSKRLIKAAEDDPLETSAILGLGIGSIGMLGGRVIGVKGTLDSLTRFFEMLGSDKARRWAGPVFGVLTVGLAAYIIVDLPRAIPRNIGRKLALSLTSTEEPDQIHPSSTTPASQQPTTFSSAHADRIAKETRKVLRLAGWDLRERFRAALEQSEKERRQVEGVVDKSRLALTWLAEFDHKVSDEQEIVQAVDV
ncbi:mitofusin [Microbotryomycetes sp. JL201]|nr:mitofusin [Microbotryomycetes sp. JL201]